MTQALLPAVYPILRGNLDLSFAQVGFLTFVYQMTASLLQPFIGLYTDRRPMPYSLPFGMASSMAGLLTIAFAPSYAMLLAGSMLLGLGSSIFHPEILAHRQACFRRLAWSRPVFVSSRRQLRLGARPSGRRVHRAAARADRACLVRARHSGWHHHSDRARPLVSAKRACEASIERRASPPPHAVARASVKGDVDPDRAHVSKFIYLASFTSYYTFYLMDKFGLSTKDAQIYQFVFFAAVAAGTVAGGPIGDRLGRKPVIWGSILGVLPFTLLLPRSVSGDRRRSAS